MTLFEPRGIQEETTLVFPGPGHPNTSSCSGYTGGKTSPWQGKCLPTEGKLTEECMESWTDVLRA